MSAIQYKSSFRPWTEADQAEVEEASKELKRANAAYNPYKGWKHLHFQAIMQAQSVSQDSSPVFLGCLERKIRETIAILSNIPNGMQETVHIGVGFHMNFNIMASEQTNYAILFENNVHLSDAHMALEAIIKETPDHYVFSLLFEAFLNERIADFAVAESKYREPHAWYRDPKTYQRIRKLYQQERVLVLSADLLEERETCKKVAQWVVDKQLKISTVYTSSEQQRAAGKPGKVAIFKQNLAALASVSRYCWIDAATPPYGKGRPIQRVWIVDPQAREFPDSPYTQNHR